MNLIQQHEKKVKINFYKVTKKALKKIKNGIYTYKNQKKWMVQT